MLTDYERYRSAALEYPDIQGLRIIPLGVVILALAPRNLVDGWLGRQGDCTFTLPLLLAAIIAWFLLGRYYARTFGRVTPRPTLIRRLFETLGVLALLVAAIILENVLYRANRGLLLSPIGLTLAALYLGTGILYRRWYYILFGLIMASVSILPVLTRTSVGDPYYGTFGLVFNIIFGLLVIFTGLLDHLRLVRYFHPSEGGSHARLE